MTAGMVERIVIVGAGQAAHSAITTLRSEGYAGSLVLIGDEPHPPYERPPLSKAILTGEAVPDSIYLAAADALAATGTVQLAATATRIDRPRKLVETDVGDAIRYDRLLIATGGRARRLEAAPNDDDAIHTLRSLQDAAAIRASLMRGGHIVVIGGGWIGLEVAASARKLGLVVTLVEASPRICNRTLPALAADALLALHVARGVDFRLGTGVAGITRDGASLAVRLTDGGEFPADAVVVGIGMTPNVDLARAAAIEVGDGVLIDTDGRTSDPDVFAAGDVAESATDRRRIESWANANEQGAAAARAMLGRPRVEPSAPWFWSDQYDVNLQILGEAAASDTVVALDAPGKAAGSWCFLRDDKLAGVIAFNRPRDVQVGRRLMRSGVTIDAGRLAEASLGAFLNRG